MKHALSLILLAGACSGTPVPLTEPPLPDQEVPMTRHTFFRGGEDREPDVSPDGEYLIFASTSFSSHYDLYQKKIGGTTVTRLTTTEDSDERFPKFNPAYPNTIAFASNAYGSWDIIVIEDILNEPTRWRRITDEESMDIHPSWSPDGTRLVWCSTTDISGGLWFLKVHDLVTGRTHTFETVDGLLPEWNPKDNRIVFQRMEHRDDWFGALWTVEYEDGELRNATSVYRGDDWAAINPSWSPDGTQIVFATVAKSLARSGVLDEADDLWIVNADGTRPMRLTTHPAADWKPVWGRNGRIFFVSKRDGANRIWSLMPRPLP